MKGGRLDYFLVNSREVEDVFIQRYRKDGARQVLLGRDDRSLLERMGFQVIEGSFVSVKKGYIRHDADAIAGMIAQLLQDK